MSIAVSCKLSASAYATLPAPNSTAANWHLLLPRHGSPSCHKTKEFITNWDCATSFLLARCVNQSMYVCRCMCAQQSEAILEAVKPPRFASAHNNWPELCGCATLRCVRILTFRAVERHKLFRASQSSVWMIAYIYIYIFVCVLVCRYWISNKKHLHLHMWHVACCSQSRQHRLDSNWSWIYRWFTYIHTHSQICIYTYMSAYKLIVSFNFKFYCSTPSWH